MAGIIAADFEAVEEEKGGNGGPRGWSTFVDGVEGEEEVDRKTRVDTVRVLQLDRRCPIRLNGDRNIRWHRTLFNRVLTSPDSFKNRGQSRDDEE
nr:unnamed protein product [Spirometra erinaceieuropaei]